ncbi:MULTISPECIES: PaaI family thioesterase [unclassified Streptomyces]|uniref:PaaI family thioesterase n=1 Tax=unclassified Streptomyces TaxID=2593676 RepID=UPI0022B5F99C|nr:MULTISPECIES: PaaI family thioesterase [unclassified Streptomyces]MCZ7415188.1 PaaI family thioesterase [Streptomyces sp. WMMC897]MCZ7432133.1 PaaI family thioesterase [Streptomyces sp. WMMC1477]
MSQDFSPRTHTATIEWQDQGPLFATNSSASGLSYLRGLISGEVVAPPVAQVLGISVVKADPGAVQFTMPVKNFFTNHLGVLAGGILSTLVDSALGCSILSAIPEDKDIVTLDLNVDFLRPVRGEEGLVTVDAEVVHLGRNRGLASCRVIDADGRLCAVGKSSCLVRSKAPAEPAQPADATGGAEPRR